MLDTPQLLARLTENLTLKASLTRLLLPVQHSYLSTKKYKAY